MNDDQAAILVIAIIGGIAVGVAWWLCEAQIRRRMETLSMKPLPKAVLKARRDRAVNLRVLAAELTKDEGGRESMPIAQVTELLGVLGRRWRAVGADQAAREFTAIVRRAGRRRG